MFAEAGKRGLARSIVINRLDGDNIHFDDLSSRPSAKLSAKPACCSTLPIGSGRTFSGVVSVLIRPPERRPGVRSIERGPLYSWSMPSSKATIALMEKYLMEGDVVDRGMVEGLPKALAAGTVVPIFCTSAKKDKDIGVAELLEAITSFARRPVQGRQRKATKGSGDKAAEVELQPSDSAEFVAQVFKTLIDKFVGNLSFFRVYLGQDHRRAADRQRAHRQIVAQRRPVADAGQDQQKRHRGHCRRHRRRRQGRGSAASATRSAPTPTLPSWRRRAYPTPMFGLAVEPKARGDEQKISGSLHKIADEDPTFSSSAMPKPRKWSSPA